MIVRASVKVESKPGQGLVSGSVINKKVNSASLRDEVAMKPPPQMPKSTMNQKDLERLRYQKKATAQRHLSSERDHPLVARELSEEHSNSRGYIPPRRGPESRASNTGSILENQIQS
jgi:hypothetical protein